MSTPRVNFGTAGFHDLSESARLRHPNGNPTGYGIGFAVCRGNRKFPFCDPLFKLVELLEGLLQGKQQLGDLRPAKSPLIIIRSRASGSVGYGSMNASEKTALKCLSKSMRYLALGQYRPRSSRLVELWTNRTDLTWLDCEASTSRWQSAQREDLRIDLQRPNSPP